MIKLIKHKINSRKLTKIIFTVYCLLFTAFPQTVNAQTYPVQVNPQLIPPYSLKLSDYQTTSAEKLFVNLLLTDTQELGRQVRLKMYIEGQGLNIQTLDFVTGATPIFLDGGINQRLSNLDLQSYFNLNNLIGLTPQQYNQALPDGRYNFCFEVYDFLSGQRLSRKSCFSVYLILNDPPILNIPNRGDLVTAQNPQNIIFNWTPRHLNATGVQYEFTLKELWDTGLDPQAAFLSSPPLFQTTTFATTLLHGPAEIQLLEGKTYGWQVRALVSDGISETSVFRNNGYSEIYHFKYEGNCDTPNFILSEAQSSQTVQITWGVSEHLRYQIQYRKKGYGDNDWFDLFSYNQQSTIHNLEAGVTYEFRVGGECTPQGGFAFSQIHEFTTPTEEEDAYYNCGVLPEVEITNQDPLLNLGTNEVFTAGDFPVTVKEVSVSNGTYSGWGFIVVPYLADTKIRVEFNSIQINTDFQLTGGVVETSYDADWINVESADEFIEGLGDLVDTIYDTLEDALEGLGILDGDYNEENIDFEIEDVVVNENGETVVIGANGEEQNLGSDNNTVVTDENGNVIAINEDGEIGAINNDSDDLKETPYFLKVDKRTKKYKYNDKIYFVRQKTNAILSLKTTVDSLKFTNPKWEMGSVNLGEGDSIFVDLKTLKNERIDIVDINDNEKEFRIKKMKIYDKPVTNIKKESEFGGYFGFDEAEETKLQNNGDYNPQFTDSVFHKEFSINKTKKYFVKWITLTPSQTVDLKIDKTFIKSEMKKDSTFSIKFKSSTPDLTFTFSGTQELVSSYDDLDFPLQISAGAVTNDADFNSPHTITAYDQSNEVVGKINIVLGKIRTPKQEIVLIRVKHDNSGYSNYNIGQTISLLNQEAYNQAYINWTNTTTDTLNVKTQYTANPSKFNATSSSAINEIKNLYEQNHVMDDKKYYVFVTDIRVTTSEGNVAGRAKNFNTNSLILLKDRQTKTILHELGHCLGMQHTFSNGQGAREIPKGTTNSFMDYSSKRNMFFLFQLKHLFNYQFENENP